MIRFGREGIRQAALAAWMAFFLLVSLSGLSASAEKVSVGDKLKLYLDENILIEIKVDENLQRDLLDNQDALGRPGADPQKVRTRMMEKIYQRAINTPTDTISLGLGMSSGHIHIIGENALLGTVASRSGQFTPDGGFIMVGEEMLIQADDVMADNDGLLAPANTLVLRGPMLTEGLKNLQWRASDLGSADDVILQMFDVSSPSP